MSQATCKKCGRTFEPTEADRREASITGMWCDRCWFEMTEGEHTCAPNYPKTAEVDVRMAFTCADCEDTECEGDD